MGASPSISAMAVRVPPFWSRNPEKVVPPAQALVELDMRQQLSMSMRTALTRG